ncbi:GNAT family N-acetyltransferase [Methylobacterium iners]|uniref:N-acetyltransferase domain-containing protein n=1 Tax=Methylobacterium iners TaxID=418707 RepID=A0ABQ4RXW4_9HYPH|nr:GNAT family N-acetyltransferase [Methylobacterium iners]GJD94473.1 hypothetical protein OCOJLMKI_1675 [Methylobacterium iners]
MTFRDGGDGTPREGLDPAEGRIARFVRKVRWRLREGIYAGRVSVGLRRDVHAPVAVPSARIPLSLRSFEPEDLAWLFPDDDTGSGADERADIAWRLRMVERGALFSHCFVAIDETSGRPCHVQWITEAGYDAAIRRGGALPVLGPDQAMLENAYTPPQYRGMGVMTAVTAMMAKRAADVGARTVIAFVDEDNVSSLKGACRAGFRPYMIRVRRQYAFGLVRTARFDPLPADYAFPHQRP